MTPGAPAPLRRLRAGAPGDSTDDLVDVRPNGPTLTTRGRRAGRPLDAFAAHLQASLDDVPTPMYLVDRKGRVRWLNRSARELVGGKAVGRAFSSLVTRDSLSLARRNFVSKVLGETESTRFQISLRARDGKPVAVELASAAVHDDERKVLGVFGVAHILDGARESPRASAPPAGLTPRQHDVLELLAAGCSTAQIAQQLSITEDTVRNHIRAILRELGVHTRLEAVVLALRSGWL